MLADIRKYADSLVVKLLFVVLLLSFVIWGIADVFRPQSSTAWVAKVGDREISRAEFDNELRATVRQLQQSFGGNLDAATIQSFGIPRSVLTQMINRTLVEAEAASLRIRAGDELLRRTLIADSRFRTPNGQFDNAAFQAFVQRLGRTQEGFFNDLRQELSARALVESVQAGGVMPQDMLQTVERYFSEQRQVEAVAIRFDDMKLETAADDAALQAFYDAHAEDYRRPELRKVTAVIVKADDLIGRVTVDDAQIKAAYDERINEFSKPEQRTFRQMLFSDEAKARWAAQQLKAGRGWDEVAKAPEAGAPATATLGPIGRNGLPEELRAAIFDQPSGIVGDPLKSGLGWHVIEVTAIEPGSTQPLAEVSQQLSHQLAEEKAGDLLIELGNKLEEAVGRGTSLEAAAQELGLTTRTLDAVDPHGSDTSGNMLPDLPPKLVQTIYASPKGIASSLVEADRNTLFMVRVDDVQPSVLRPFADVRDAVLAAWTREQKVQKARDIAQQVVDRGNSGSFADAVASFGLKPVTEGPLTRLGTPPGTPLPTPVVRQAMEAPAGRLLTVPTDEAIFVAVSRRLPDATGAASEAVLSEEREKALDMLRDDLLAQYLEALRGRHTVRINQAALDELARQAS